MSTHFRMRQIDGWLRDEEADLLMVLASVAALEVSEGAIVEVGSYCGKSTSVLGSVVRRLAPDVPVYAIDPHEGEHGAQDSSYGVQHGEPTFDAFLRTLSDADLTDIVRPIRQPSFEVDWHDPIRLLFIDGLHDYLNVSRDFFHFEPWIAVGGYVAFHDCEDTYPGVRAFVRQVLVSGEYRAIRQAESLAVVQKTGKHSFGHEATRADLIIDQQIPSEGMEMWETRQEHNADRDTERGTLESLQRMVARQELGISLLQQELTQRIRTGYETKEEIDRLWGGIRERDEEIIMSRRLIAEHATVLAEKQAEADRLRARIEGLDTQVREQGEDNLQMKGAVESAGRMAEQVKADSMQEQAELAAYRQSKLVRVVRVYWSLRQRLSQRVFTPRD
jgi:Methyltransferase domain